MKPSSGGDGPGTAAAGRLVAPDRQWQPDLYLRYAAYRERPAHDLLAQVPDLPDDLARGLVVDLGCGPGNVTPHLAARFPRARLLGVDNAPAMLARARQLDLAATWQEADAATWTPPEPAALIYSNAVLQWLQDHDRLLPRLAGCLAPGGILAVQMPAYLRATSLTLVHDVAQDGPWAAALEGRLRVNPVAEAGFYYDLLAPACDILDLWETVYQHVMDGPDDIVTWSQGTALLPVRETLDADGYAAFVEAYRAAVHRAYPRQPDGRVLFPFRRLFLLGRRRSGG